MASPRESWRGVALIGLSLLGLALCVAVSLAASFAWGARVGVFAFPAIQLATDPVEHVMATGALMTLIGLLFLLKPARTSRPQP